MSDRLRPTYHFQPPANWMNDPNGLLQWQGRYHLFYQYNPNGAFHGTIHWGHAVTDDLVHWQDLPIALAPTPGGPDKDGVYSGCGFDNYGTPTVMYTGVRPQVQCIATADDPTDPDLTAWTKHAANPVIPDSPEGMPVEGFRDPFIWREVDGWYCVVGSGVTGEGGNILLYRSPDLVAWEYLGELCRGVEAETGRMWECPNFFPLGGKHVLLISPIPLRKVLFLVGEYREHRFTPERTGIVDDGGCYYAPQVMLDGQGRRLMWGWLREDRDVETQKASGWSGVMSLPTELSLTADGRLAVRPVAEVEMLRGAHQRLEGIEIPDGRTVPLGEVSGDRLELGLTLDPGDAAEVWLSVLRSPDGAEETRIVFDRAAGELWVDRARSTLDSVPDRERRGATVRPEADGSLRLRVFVDGSVAEVFAADGASLTSRVYPTRADSVGVCLGARGGAARIRDVDVWEMQPIWGPGERRIPE
ncbi:MAG: glycoside hydrolase family 32 protein [Chloroflexi bacterium]|nr:glycoside hydrolase family 32 protein [Chloroflexota bacterium]